MYVCVCVAGEGGGGVRNVWIVKVLEGKGYTLNAQTISMDKPICIIKIIFLPSTKGELDLA